MTTKRDPRGIRNNNPGNIRRNGDPWQGLAERQGDVEFFTFKTSIYGIRALARVLITYQDKYDLRSVRQIIERWAPPSENNTDAYVRAVAADAELDADQTLDIHRFDHLLPLTKAIIRHENGQQPYTDAQLTKGLVLAGVEPEKPSLQKTRTVKGGQAATAATAGLGYMVLSASEFLVTEVVILGILIIGAVAYLFDLGMRWLERRLVPWKGKV